MGQPIAGFARGVMNGLAMRQSMGSGRDDDESKAAPVKDAAPAQSTVGAATADNGYVASDPVAPDLKPYQRAFLNSISAGESGGDYNVRYGGANGPQQFDGFDKHPGIFEDGPEGKSSAAGRYQFTKSTWDDLGGGAFTPENQDMRALELARQRYKASTRRDLDADLQARGMGADIAQPLAMTWTSLRGKGQGRAAAAYEDSLKRYGGGAPATAEAVLDIPRKPRSIIGTMAETVKSNIGSPGDNWKTLRGLFG